MYFLGDKYLGTYSNDMSLASVTTNEDNFGLDDYEPLFFRPLPEWSEFDEFSVFLKFDEDTDYSKDIFYFCHIHQFMTGRIKLFKDGKPLSEDNLPPIEYEYDQVDEFDEECGTYGLSAFQLPHQECPERFVCDVPQENVELAQFSSCIDSMNCAMMAGMTTSVSKPDGEAALFNHQMIPHHQNAVNMAKALLKTGTLSCADYTDETDDCALEVILREIINGQNHQIQVMRSILDSKNLPPDNDCVVDMNRDGSSSGETQSQLFQNGSQPSTEESLISKLSVEDVEDTSSPITSSPTPPPETTAPSPSPTKKPMLNMAGWAQLLAPSPPPTKKPVVAVDAEAWALFLKTPSPTKSPTNRPTLRPTTSNPTAQPIEPEEDDDDDEVSIKVQDIVFYRLTSYFLFLFLNQSRKKKMMMMMTTMTTTNRKKT